MKKFFLLLLLLFILVGVGISWYGYSRYKDMVNQGYQPLSSENQGMVSDEESNKADEREEKAKELEEPEEPETIAPFTLMILGVDTREGERKSRSDTMMLAAVNPKQHKVSLLSIPRDTLAQIPGHGHDKFNHSMFYGGPTLVKETIEQFFNIPVDHYIMVDFQGFTKIVDALGGITVDVGRRMKYHDPVDGTKIDIMPGEQVLNGKKALDYARFRKSDIGSASSDFDRMQRQQEVVRQVAEKATNITSLFKVFTMMGILKEHVKTDLKEAEIRRLAVQFHNFHSSQISTINLRGTNKRMPAHGFSLWFYVVEDKEKKRISDEIKKTLSLDSSNIAVKD